MTEPIEVFVRRGCKNCHEFTDELVKKDILFRPRMLDDDPDAMADLMMHDGQTGKLPWILADGHLYNVDGFWAKVRRDKKEG